MFLCALNARTDRFLASPYLELRELTAEPSSSRFLLDAGVGWCSRVPIDRDCSADAVFPMLHGRTQLKKLS